MKNGPSPRTGDSAVFMAPSPDFVRTAPVTRAFNHLIAGAQFERKFGRWPLRADDPEASINDLIFGRMINPSWSALQRAFVDKSTAKEEAVRLCPDLRVTETLTVIAMDSVRTLDHLYERLAMFAGTDAIAKPSHASGGIVFLRDIAAPADLHLLHSLGCLDYALLLREMQYWRLPRRIIVEALVPTDGTGAPDDYKFHCIHGEPLLCQIDHGRFGKPWSRIFHVPDFAPMDDADGIAPVSGYRLPDPDRLTAMIAAARALSAPFDYVRVDLYNGSDGAYFGELTFTAAASLGIAPSSEGSHRENASHRKFSQILMTAYRKGGRSG